MIYARLVWIICFAGIYSCTQTPLTPEQIAAKEIHEMERVEKYAIWEKACLQAGGIIFFRNVLHSSRRQSVPRRSDWDFYYLPEGHPDLDDPRKPVWRAKPKTVHCIDRRDLGSLF